MTNITLFYIKECKDEFLDARHLSQNIEEQHKIYAIFFSYENLSRMGFVCSCISTARITRLEKFLLHLTQQQQHDIFFPHFLFLFYNIRTSF